MADNDQNRRIWTSDWKRKVYIRLCAADADSVTEWLSRYPGVPYLELADVLGSDVAAFQIEMLHVEEAQQRRDLRRFALDSLARDIHEYLRNGWKVQIAGDFETAAAFGTWTTRLIGAEPKLRPFIDAVWKDLNQSPPPAGWLPSGADDPVLVAAFGRAWPFN